jgi:salicylate hydroxylase
MMGANARAAQRAKKEYNLVMMHPDEAEQGVESWTAHGNVERMKESYKGWNTVLVTPF